MSQGIGEDHSILEFIIRGSWSFAWTVKLDSDYSWAAMDQIFRFCPFRKVAVCANFIV